MNPYHLYVNSCSDSAPHYTPFTAVNASQYSSMKTVIISLSAAPQETLTIYTRPLWGNMLHLLSPFWGTVKTDVKVSENRAVALYCASSVIGMDEIHHALSGKTNQSCARCAESEAPFNLAMHDRGELCLLRHSTSHQGDGEEKGRYYDNITPGKPIKY